MNTWEVAPVPEPQQGDFLKLFHLTSVSFQEFHFLVVSWTAFCPHRRSCTCSVIQNTPSVYPGVTFEGLQSLTVILFLDNPHCI